jgi:ribonucleoside-diphosphate reductase beta chain
MASILSHPPMVYKFAHGYDFPEFNDYFKKAILSVWNPWEVSLKSDCLDWDHNLSQSEKDLVAGVLRGFTSAELGISCYWGDTVCRTFPKPEIQDMARTFSAFERIHAAAYNYLSDTLGLNEFEEFMADEAAKTKVERFFTECESEKVSLAVFSGCGEGVSLYSSFAILLSFNRGGRLKGLAQIISWSVSDEVKHSDAGSLLFKYLVKEVGITEEEKAQIKRGFDAIIANEYSFLESIFDKVDNTAIPIALNDLKAYILYRANDRLQNLDLDMRYEMDDEQIASARNIASWFDPMVKGQTNNDFFSMAKNGSGYVAKPSQDFDNVDLRALDLVLT